MRGWGDVLRVWRLCPRTACMRARACRGDARDCLPRHFTLLPHGVQEWFAGINAAQREGAPFDEAIEWLDSEGLGEALGAWCAAVEQSLPGRPKPPPLVGEVK
jgi:hypothetical protein